MRRSTRSRRGIVAAASLAAALALATVHSASALAADAFPAGGVMPEGWIVAPDVAAGWAVASGPAFEGTFSLKSEPIENGQRAGIEVSGTFTAGTLSFARRVSSEAGFDFLRFYIDGVFQQEWSGDTGWAVAAYGVTAGPHTFRWEYEKDDVVAAGADAAWIDGVMLPPASTTPTFAFAATGYSIDEGAGPGVIAVKRSKRGTETALALGPVRAYYGAVQPVTGTYRFDTRGWIGQQKCETPHVFVIPWTVARRGDKDRKSVLPVFYSNVYLGWRGTVRA